jgi:rSAM/selenodomain-associated transferase 1
VKTRLAAGIGEERAAAIYKSMIRLLLHQLSGLHDCHLRFCCAPDDAQDAIRFWLLPEIMDSPAISLPTAHLDFHPQGGGDLGARLTRATAAAFAEGYEKVVVIGSDCIEISSRWIHAALAQLNGRHDAVIGPTPDGGYHLLATSRPLPMLFSDIPWSSPQTYAATLARAAAHHLTVYELPFLPDIDNAQDFESALAGPLGPKLKHLLSQEAG